MFLRVCVCTCSESAEARCVFLGCFWLFLAGRGLLQPHREHRGRATTRTDSESVSGCPGGGGEEEERRRRGGSRLCVRHIDDLNYVFFL